MVALMSGITPQQYLEWERKAETKSEYVNGQIYAMSDASRRHNIIALNFGAALNAQLQQRPCETYVGDMRVKVNETGKYAYPDVSAACGDIEFEDAEVDTLLNPILIVEVLSPSTENYDRIGKFAHYRRLPSLQEYILIAQDRIQVEQFARQGEHWLFSEYNSLEAELILNSVHCRIPLRSIYAKVAFPPIAEDGED